MCGRIKQARGLDEYLNQVRWNARDLVNVAAQPRHNVPPGTRPVVLHRLGDGAQQVDRLFWGYKPE